ncbi:MliC family protein [Wohlfahrtiimonas larvae]|uniref:C-type lysozyme inhibitor domain-containing protein n=1 Tax=Wohlfahrtiimonas larvae TaxID=1157986 RepID=A0ABP9MY71_9GAMM|nr:MliC family protein [Wohlfahrtiimonas larvae]
MNRIIKTMSISAVIFGLSACATQTTGLEGYTTTATESYQCGTDQITATFLNHEDNSIALMSINDENPILLANIISASGAKYQGGIYELWTKGDTATFRNLLKAPKRNIQCKTVTTKSI